jgi:hypothetical protein
MTHEVTCSSCKHLLRVSEGSRSPWLTCPRCLARVVNPAALVQTGPPADRPEPPQRGPEERLCPRCGRGVDPGWRACPICGTSLDARRSFLDADSLEREVRRDATGGHVIASILGVLVLIGLVLFFSAGGGRMLADNQAGFAWFLLLVFFTVVGGMILVGYTAESAAVKTVVGIVGGLILGVVAVVLSIMLLCFQACSSGSMSGPLH